MAAVGNDRYFHFHAPYAQQKYRNISCFWETQPSGCARINCAFHHSKPRNINGLFLPPSNNVPLQEGVQEGILHPTLRRESLRKRENILPPIHPPLIINVNSEEDEEDDEEEMDTKDPSKFLKIWGQNYKFTSLGDVSNRVPKTAEDIQEERAIKEICYTSGEYYRIRYPHKHQSRRTVSSPRENELSPLEATERDLQKGGDCSVAQRNTFVEGKRHEALPWEKGPTASKYSNLTRYLIHVIRLRESSLKLPLILRNNVYVFSIDKYTSGSYNAPTWRKRNPRAKTFSKFQTTIQSREDMEVRRKGEGYVERRKR
ncbi:uncharacterized protein C12orf50 homolog [Gavia stellata]|uniref:uncharacterized protein C12orf50 homolog n=2 Tax=Gavia stellata TaxID=37040 RepID=UPI0028A1D2BD|nr:uncharacterized protein C12orf50 homolog [Gavia stellata]